MDQLSSAQLPVWKSTSPNDLLDADIPINNTYRLQQTLDLLAASAVRSIVQYVLLLHTWNYCPPC